MHATASPTMPCSEPAGSSCAQQVLLRLGGASSSLLGAEASRMLRAMASAQSVDCNCGPGLSKSRSASDEVRDASKLATRERATARSAEYGLCGCRSLLAAWRRFGGIGCALLLPATLAPKDFALLVPVVLELHGGAQGCCPPVRGCVARREVVAPANRVNAQAVRSQLGHESGYYLLQVFTLIIDGRYSLLPYLGGYRTGKVVPYIT